VQQPLILCCVYVLAARLAKRVARQGERRQVPYGGSEGDVDLLGARAGVLALDPVCRL
jgi:hypothetical protein